MVECLVGDVLEVQDRRDLNFYECKVIGVRSGECRVHYVGWGARHDEWVSLSSDRIRPLLAADGSSVSASPTGSGSSVSVASFVASLEAFSEGSISAAREVHRRASVGGVLPRTPLRSHAAESPVACKLGDLAGGGGLAADVGASCVDSVSSGKAGGGVHCLFCCALIVGSHVSCSVCLGRFHARPSCLGVDDEVVSCLLKDTGGAVQYFCCKCRCTGKEGPSHGSGEAGLVSAFKQLLVAVGSLTRRVDELASHCISAPVGDAASGLHALSSARNSASVSREEVRLELKELQEQHRRQNSVILRGFQVETANAVREKFAGVCVALDVGEIELDDLVRISGTSLFRARILNLDQRRELLDCTKNLRHLEDFKSLYVQRDLTYRQRRELVARRAGAAGGDVNGTGSVGEVGRGGFSRGSARLGPAGRGSAGRGSAGRGSAGHGSAGRGHVGRGGVSLGGAVGGGVGGGGRGGGVGGGSVGGGAIDLGTGGRGGRGRGGRGRGDRGGGNRADC